MRIARFFRLAQRSFQVNFSSESGREFRRDENRMKTYALSMRPDQAGNDPDEEFGHRLAGDGAVDDEGNAGGMSTGPGVTTTRRQS
jgi:hypothetical protein